MICGIMSGFSAFDLATSSDPGGHPQAWRFAPSTFRMTVQNAARGAVNLEAKECGMGSRRECLFVFRVATEALCLDLRAWTSSNRFWYGLAAGLVRINTVLFRRNYSLTLTMYFANASEPWARPMVKMGDVMRLWLEYDPIALAVLLFGIVAVELLSLSI
jgi:hypothetical protein